MKTILPATALLIALAQPVFAQTVTTTTTTVTLAAPPPRIQGAACQWVGRVVGLDPYGDNNLSVRTGPYGPRGLANEIDELFTGDNVCVWFHDGAWLHISYERDGRMFTGWVHSRYVAAD
jgi:hypothetical protein